MALTCVLAGTAFGLVACGGSGATHASSAPPPAAASAQQQFAAALAARLGPRGEIDPQLALDVLSTFFGAKAGGHALPGADALFDGSLAHDVAASAWAKLDAQQRSTIASLFALRAAGGHGKARLASPRPAPAADVTRANAVATQIASHLGHPLGMTLTVVSEPDSPYPPSTIADTTPRDASGEDAFVSGGTMRDCYVRLFPSYFTGPESDVALVLAHELFHCFQDARIYCAGCSHTPAPPWVMEGEAEWAGAELAPGAEQPFPWWRIWLRNSVAALEARSYDAVGFYAAAAQRGHDPWSFMLDLVTIPATDMARAYARATGVSDATFMAAVGAFDLRVSALGAHWNATGPAIPPPDRPALRDVGPGASVSMHPTLDPYSAASDVFAVHADVVTITSGAEATAVGFAGGPTHTFTDPGAHTYCVAGDACACPDGSPIEGGLTVAHDDGGIVGVAVGTTSAMSPTITISARQLDRSRCSSAPTTVGAVPACVVGTWRLTHEEVTLAAAASAISALHIVGHDNGKRMHIGADGSFSLTDDGSDPTTQSSNISGVAVNFNVAIRGQVSGTVSGTATHLVFDGRSVDLTIALSGSAGGAPINNTQHFTSAHDAAFFGTGPADVHCSGSSLTLTFPNATFTYAKA